ncbi:MAG: FkbM family methyltransferase [Alphaproteobacteria bacterium]|nr:FkbM family methyltransferase [Alphaproteobacteria bacterium]
MVAFRRTPRVVIDIGANIGAFALRAHRQWPGARIIAYEPLPSNVARLRANLGVWAEIVPAAVRATSGTQSIFLGDLFVTGGFTKGVRQREDQIAVDCVAAKDLPGCDLLKIDTEGSEVEILSNINLDRINTILVEFHSRKDADTIRRRLSSSFDCISGQSGEEVGTLILERRDETSESQMARQQENALVLEEV